MNKIEPSDSHTRFFVGKHSNHDLDEGLSSEGSIVHDGSMLSVSERSAFGLGGEFA